MGSRRVGRRALDEIAQRVDGAQHAELRRLCTEMTNPNGWDRAILMPLALAVPGLLAETEMLRGVDCEAGGDGSCGACIKCAQRERDETRAVLLALVQALQARSEAEAAFELTAEEIGVAGQMTVAADFEACEARVTAALAAALAHLGLGTSGAAKEEK